MDQVEQLKKMALRSVTDRQKVKELTAENTRLRSQVPSMQKRLEEAQRQQRLEQENRRLRDENYYLHLTDAGREAAEATYERHRFFTEMLVAAGVDPVIAERDACRIEHVISKETFERLKAARKLSEKAVISSDES